MNINIKNTTASLSIISNTFLILLKIIAGIISGSISIISEAFHSLSDLLASAITFFAVTRSSKPADKNHPFGHGRYEDVAGFLEGLIMIVATFFIVLEACKKIISHSYTNINSNLAITVMCISVIVNFLVSTILFNVAKKTESIALKADAKHLCTDIYSALGVLIGLALIKHTGLTIIDPLIAIFVALIILKAAVELIKETFNNLVDGTLPKTEIDVIIDILEKRCDIISYKNIKTRKCGHTREIDFTLICNENTSIKDCHKICDEIETQIKNALSNSHIVIHCEPNVSN